MKKWLCFLSVLALTAGCAANPKTPEATPETSPELTAETTPVSLSILGPTGSSGAGLDCADEGRTGCDACRRYGCAAGRVRQSESGI